jgi:hypothetical protein
MCRVSAAVAAKASPLRPIYSRTILEIPRSEARRLIVEVCKWDEARPPVVKFSLLARGKQGVWYVSPARAFLRLSELTRVATALLEVSE